MALLSIYRGTQAEVSKRPVSDGALLFATDTKKIYLDKGSSRVEMSSLQDLSDYITNEELTEGLATKAPLSHSHTTAQVTGLDSALAGKAATGHTHAAATDASAGFMSAADKEKLDGIASGANKYTLPTASSSTLGGVKTGANITNSSGTISLTKANVTAALGYTPPTTDTNTWIAFKGATTSAAGIAGYVPAPTAGAANRYFRSDGTWTVPPNTNTTYTLTKSGSTITLEGSDGSKTSVTDTNTTYTLGSFGITATAAELNKLDGCTATVTELNYVDGVTSNIQTQLNGKAAASHNHSAANITSGTLAIARGGTGATTAAAARTALGITPANIGAAASSHTHSYLPLSGGTLTGAVTHNAKNNRYLCSGGSWINGKTATNVPIVFPTASETDGSRYDPYMWGQNTDGDVWNFGGGASNQVGFFGFNKGRTENGTDWSVYMDITTGKLTATAGFAGALSGNATSANKLTTARTISLTGDVTGSTSFNGSANVSISANLAANSVTANEIAAGAVGSSELASNAVTLAKLGSDVGTVAVQSSAPTDTNVKLWIQI